MTRGRIRRAWLGIAGSQTLLPLALAASTRRRTGLGGAQVIPGSPAADAGLRQGDFVLVVPHELGDA